MAVRIANSNGPSYFRLYAVNVFTLPPSLVGVPFIEYSEASAVVEDGWIVD